MKCPGVHCPGCGSGGGISAGAVAALVCLAVYVLNRRAIDHAASMAVEVLTVAALCLAGLCVAGLAAAVTVAVVRARRARLAARLAARPLHFVPGRVLSGPESHAAALAGRPVVRALPAAGSRAQTDTRTHAGRWLARLPRRMR